MSTLDDESIVIFRVLWQEGGEQVRYFDTEDAANRHGKWLANWHVGCKPLVCAMRVWPDDSARPTELGEDVA